MKIAVWYNLPSGGGKRALYDHLVGLKALGHELEIWRPPVQQGEYLDLSQIAPEHAVHMDEFQRESRFYAMRIYLAMDNMRRLVDVMDRHSRACAEQINRGGFDVLFANTDLWFHTPFIGRYVDIPRVLYVGEPNRPLYEAEPRLRWLFPKKETSGPLLKRLKLRGRAQLEMKIAQILATEEVENAHNYERILVNSLYSRETVLRTYGVDARVCYLGIDASLFEYRDVPREPFLISVGTMTQAKNPELAIRAIGAIPKFQRPRLVWVYNFAGYEEFVDEMRALAKDLDVDLDLKRYISDSELVDLLNRAYAFIYTPRLEPFGLAPLEANACGAPVVAVAEGGVRESIQDGVNGVLTDGYPLALAAGLQGLLDNPSEARRLGENGARLVRDKWSPSAAAKRLEAHLIEVASEGRTARGITP